MLASICVIATLAIVFIQPVLAAVGDWQVQGSNIYYNDGKVGIGTTNPGTNLDVNGSVTVSNNKSFNFRDSFGNYDGTRLYRGTGDSLRMLYNASQFSIDALDDNPFIVRDSGLNNVFYISPVGKSYLNNPGGFGIGTVNPNADLEVNGGNGSVEVKITADENNAGGEDNQPVLTFSQDGGIKTSQMGYFDSNNNFVVKNNASNTQLQLKDNGDVCLGTC